MAQSRVSGGSRTRGPWAGTGLLRSSDPWDRVPNRLAGREYSLAVRAVERVVRRSWNSHARGWRQCRYLRPRAGRDGVGSVLLGIAHAAGHLGPGWPRPTDKHSLGANPRIHGGRTGRVSPLRPGPSRGSRGRRGRVRKASRLGETYSSRVARQAQRRILPLAFAECQRSRGCAGNLCNRARHYRSEEDRRGAAGERGEVPRVVRLGSGGISRIGHGGRGAPGEPGRMRPAWLPGERDPRPAGVEVHRRGGPGSQPRGRSPEAVRGTGSGAGPAPLPPA